MGDIDREQGKVVILAGNHVWVILTENRVTGDIGWELCKGLILAGSYVNGDIVWEGLILVRNHVRVILARNYVKVILTGNG